ncbi:hypothetical protein K461DRAFT_258171 [Myriangium duriaei CBS 260.36]|uniref:Cleavage and polyadenylation specificity factor subunit 2 n=1 Tax=Myriangium duriaei CBS 260.36 TaxID=1168546 RepID=A0A9P4MKW2_9PEZI|nr:hypothetical protein K461DRAFT_258171 [Myriangium duriaei CBS 260.36]
MFTFTPLLGAQSDSAASQSLLELDGGIKILIDVGWDDSYDVESLQALESQISSISFVLLTHPTIDHLGAFAHLCKHVPQFKSIPAYATSPVISLGRTLLQDLYASSPRAATIVPSAALAEAVYSSATGTLPPSILLQAPTSEEIAGYFSLINPLKYSQPLQPIASPFSPSVDGVTITAYSAGHTLGGTIWHIQHGLESIIYAVDWNQAKENTLSGAAWLGGAGGGAEILEPLRRPTAMICSSKGIERPHVPGGRRKRDDRLLEAIDKTVSSGGVVLIPSDSSARILELAYIVEQHWRKQLASDANGVYKSAKAHLASKTAGSTLRFARSMVEWMDDGLVREMEAANDAQKGQRGGEEKIDQTPFDFRHIKLVERKTRLQRVLIEKAPGVILASNSSLDWGLSVDILQNLCADPKNLVILTEQQNVLLDATTNTISAQLWRIWESSVRDRNSSTTEVIRRGDVQVTATHSETQLLQGDELSIYQQYLARRRQMQSTQQGDDLVTGINPAEAAADDQSSASSESSDESDNEQQGRALNLTAAMNQSKRKVGLTDEELGINILIRKKNVYDYDVRGKRGREKMFPFASKRSKDDEYGDIIRPEDYLRAEERDEDAQAETTKQDESTTMGQKRKWDDSASKAQDARRQKKNTGKRQRTTDGQGLTSSTRVTNGDTADGTDDSSDSDSDSEAEDLTPTSPQKIIFKSVPVTITMGICHIDFSGLHEKRDLQMLIPMIKPRKLVITSGRADETHTLAEDCRVLLHEEDAVGAARIVFTPRTGETVDASVDTNAWSVKLTRDLVKRLAWQTVKGLGVVAVTARLGVAAPMTAGEDEDEADEQRKKKLKLLQEPGAGTEGTPAEDGGTREVVLDILPSTSAVASVLTTQPIHVGDLRLADLRRLMQASGHLAEFRGEGTLLIDGFVIVRKSAGGRIDVESGAYAGVAGGRYDAAGSFFDVRRKIYEGLAVPPKKKKKKCKSVAPPGLVAGAAYVFPRKHTYVHIIRNVKVWEPGTGSKWGFKIHRVPTSLSVGEFLEAMCGGDGDAAKGACATEVVELGDGAWSKGLSVEYGSDKAGATMASLGWNEKRGGDNSLPPVWLVLHKA